MIETITASIATIKGREKALEKAVSSLLPQVDRLCIYFNYQPISFPVFDYPCKIEYCVGNNEYRDTAKFWWTDKIPGYHLICDDDLYYPPDFAAFMEDHCDEFGVVALMGRNYPKRKINSYYRDFDKDQIYRMFENVKVWHKVELIGTCALCFHTDDIKISVENQYFENLNSDLWFSILCREAGVEGFALPHKADYVKYLLSRDDWTVFKEYSFRDELQTRLFNERMR